MNLAKFTTDGSLAAVSNRDSPFNLRDGNRQQIPPSSRLKVALAQGPLVGALTEAGVQLWQTVQDCGPTATTTGRDDFISGKTYLPRSKPEKPANFPLSREVDLAE